MSPLVPNLFDRRFDDLVELGRSQLPALAPEWTDHNAHDPGITLIELLAWTAEAQLYSLGRTRRDERLAYAALAGVEPRGTRPARGLIWSDGNNPSSPSATFAGSRVIAADAPVRLEEHDEPIFHPERKILWVPGRVVRLSSRSADGTVSDLTTSNERGTPFLPFGEGLGRRDVLDLEFETRGDAGFFPKRRNDAEGTCWVIGVRAADESEVRGEEEPKDPCPATLSVALVTGTDRDALPVLEDSTAGLLRTGVLCLDVSRVTGSPRKFHVEIRAPRGFVRPPRWLRVEPNVLPITERLGLESEQHEATGQPEFGFELDVPGLCLEPDAEPPRVKVQTDTEFQEWKPCDRLSEKGPDDRVYELDAARGRLQFGNGVNGRKPASGAQVYVSYSVSSGPEGNVASNRKWTVLGFGGVFGINPDPVAGGIPRTDWTVLRRAARRHASGDHAIVTAADIESAALALPLLGVDRAWVVPPSTRAPQTGTVTLIAVRERPGGIEPAQPPETARWLGAVRRRLASRMPLGTRLAVAAPRYAEFLVRIEVEIEEGRDPKEIVEAVKTRLDEKLALIGSPAAPPREPGVPVSSSDVAAWILGVEGVERVASLELVRGRKVVNTIDVPRGGLPRLQLGESKIEAVRPEAGSRS